MLEFKVNLHLLTAFTVIVHVFSLRKPMETMLSRELIKFVAQYKFSLSFENAECEDYITEKLWRPLIAGSVPVYIGSPSVRVSTFIQLLFSSLNCMTFDK